MARGKMKRSTLPLFALLTATAAMAQAPPPQAVAAGYTHLAFHDEFNSPDTVSPNGTGNYNWYRTSFYSPSLTLPSWAYSIQDGFLTIYSDASGFSDGLQTAAPENTVQAWQHGYFEASILFCQYCSDGGTWPAFWSSSIAEVTGQVAEGTPYAELDFMEYYTQSRKSTYETNVHQFIEGDSGSNVQNANDIPKIPPGTNFGTWHTYGCLWTPNQVQWYFDNKLVTTVATGPGTPFTALEQSKMFLILGTGQWWPMNVDYVRVYQ
jgi:beta-glucanase (GH16 family)